MEGVGRKTEQVCWGFWTENHPLHTTEIKLQGAACVRDRFTINRGRRESKKAAETRSPSSRALAVYLQEANLQMLGPCGAAAEAPHHHSHSLVFKALSLGVCHKKDFVTYTYIPQQCPLATLCNLPSPAWQSPPEMSCRDLIGRKERWPPEGMWVSGLGTEHLGPHSPQPQATLSMRTKTRSWQL